MNGKRQKTSQVLARKAKDQGEALSGVDAGAEPSMAVTDLESPALLGQLMEEVCDRENLQRAWQRVRRNKGGPGVDGMTIDDARDYLRVKLGT